MTESFVIVKFKDGSLPQYRIWRDYDQTWGSPIYEVLGYFDSYRVAQNFVKAHRTLATQGYRF